MTTVSMCTPNLQSDVVHRVIIDNDTKQCYINTFGMQRIDIPHRMVYDDVNALPIWMQRRIALLMMLKEPYGEEVQGIGRRISETVFWLYE
jgi:hypothetical protein